MVLLINFEHGNTSALKTVFSVMAILEDKVSLMLCLSGLLKYFGNKIVAIIQNL